VIALAAPLTRIRRPVGQDRLEGGCKQLDIAGRVEQLHRVIRVQQRRVDRPQQLVEGLHHPLQVVQHRNPSADNEEAWRGLR
jgi:hypothetical protein